MVAKLHVCQGCGAGYSVPKHECPRCGSRYIIVYTRQGPESHEAHGHRHPRPLDDDVIIRNIQKTSKRETGKLKKLV